MKSEETKAQERTWAAAFLPYEFRHWSRPLGPEFADHHLERWLNYVSEIEVELHPGGRAMLALPEGLTVELRWQRSEPRSYTVVSSPEGGLPVPDTFITSIDIQAEPGSLLPAVDVPISACVAALRLTLISRGMPEHFPEVRERPAAGKPPAIGFYRWLVAEYDRLLGEGHSSPVGEIALRMNERPGTVKAWLHRGRKYLRGESQ